MFAVVAANGSGLGPALDFNGQLLIYPRYINFPFALRVKFVVCDWIREVGTKTNELGAECDFKLGLYRH